MLLTHAFVKTKTAKNIYVDLSSIFSRKKKKMNNWLENGIDMWFNTLDIKKLTFKKVVFVIEKCLYLIALNDACNYMEKHKMKITNENIAIFFNLTNKYNGERLEMLGKIVSNFFLGKRKRKHDRNNTFKMASR